MNGYTGKILRLDLTARKVSTIDTKQYEQWGGGHGIGSAIFWDLCKNKAIKGTDPGNVMTIMTSPLSGTLVPSASGRTECQFIGPQSYPTEWFTRSNFGGRFSGMLKFAGWDGIVLEGKADKPVWVNVINDQVSIIDAGKLWGMNTQETQEEIWRMVNGNKDYKEWHDISNARAGGRSTQRPAVLTIGPAGERLIRFASLIHDAGNGAGQGGGGCVWGSKNLKAISVLGTGHVGIADPNGLLEARRFFANNYGYNSDNPAHPGPVPTAVLTPSTDGMIAVDGMYGFINRSPGHGPLSPVGEPARGMGCMACYVGCRRRTQSGTMNESQCVEAVMYGDGKTRDARETGTKLLQEYGLNGFEMIPAPVYLHALYKMGVLGPGEKKISTTVPFDKYGSREFIESLMKAIVFQEGEFGKDVSNGIIRAAEKWGRLQEDLDTGLLNHPNWGYPEHYDPRLEVEWSYGSIFGDRDINEHCLNWFVHWMPTITAMAGEQPLYSAAKMAEQIGSKLVPFKDPMMIDYSKEGIYSDSKVKMIAWHRRYTRFFKQSMGFCDWAWPDFANPNAKDFAGATPDIEPRFINAVTGGNMTFEQGIETGRKIWNLDRSIWILQGRHRDQEKFAGYVYKKPTSAPYYLTVHENGQWKYDTCEGRTLDEAKFEDFKTRYYKLEGWDSTSGWPTRGTLESVGLKNVADELDKGGKLGK